MQKPSLGLMRNLNQGIGKMSVVVLWAAADFSSCLRVLRKNNHQKHWISKKILFSDFSLKEIVKYRRIYLE